MSWEEIIKWNLSTLRGNRDTTRRETKEEQGPIHGGKKAEVDNCKATNCRSNHNMHCTLVRVSVDYNGKCEMFVDKKYESKSNSGQGSSYSNEISRIKRDKLRRDRGY